MTDEEPLFLSKAQRRKLKLQQEAEESSDQQNKKRVDNKVSLFRLPRADDASTTRHREVVSRLRKGMDRTAMQVMAVTDDHYRNQQHRRYLNFTVLLNAAKEMSNNPPQAGSAEEDAATDAVDWPQFVRHASQCAGQSPDLVDRALGCMVGMVLGDAVGAPLEFCAVDSFEPGNPNRRSTSHLDSTSLDTSTALKAATPVPEATTTKKHRKPGSKKKGGISSTDLVDPPVLVAALGELIYYDAKNNFDLKRGQWTDDSAMGFAMAESMLVHGGLNPQDTRIRFYNWWYFGYCNAFRHEMGDLDRCSVGLGSNIAKSLEDLFRCVGQDAFSSEAKERMVDAATAGGADAGSQDVPTAVVVDAAFQSNGGRDAGNGAIMRLAAVPIRYHSDPLLAMSKAEISSYTTHPGPDSAMCCRFLSFFCAKAMTRTTEPVSPQVLPPEILAEVGWDKRVPEGCECCELQGLKDVWHEKPLVAHFLEQTIQEFLDLENPKEAVNEGEKKEGKKKQEKHIREVHPLLSSLLPSKPLGPQEQCWDWKADRLPIEEAIKARGSKYNGYPVTLDYFGSYCMDGLAMALWALSHSESAVECIIKCVNLLGDCDSTAAVAGQMAGAYYGYESIFASPFGQRMVQDLRQWDPQCETELRALLLLEDGAAVQTKDDEEERQEKK